MSYNELYDDALERIFDFNDYYGALESLDNVLKICPNKDKHEGHNLKSCCYFSLKNFVKSEEEIEIAIKCVHVGTVEGFKTMDKYLQLRFAIINSKGSNLSLSEIEKLKNNFIRMPCGNHLPI